MYAGKGWRHLVAKVVQDYPAVQLNGWKLWPAAAMFNYRYVPLNLRVLFLNFVALGWCAVCLPDFLSADYAAILASASSVHGNKPGCT